MRPLFSAGSIVAGVLALSSPLAAQWPAYPTPRVPRTANGEPRLNAPTPTTADGKPDLSGIWRRFQDQGGGSTPKPIPAPPGTPPVAAFWDVGVGFPEGLPFQPWAAELKQARDAANSKDNPDALCLPLGIMQAHLVGVRRIIQTPDLITILYENNYGRRYVFTDGRSLPANGEPQPWWWGYSVGTWEGETLVVETNNFRDGGWLDVRGSPLTDQARVAERFRRVNVGKLEIDITIDDPKAYTRPFTVRVNQEIMVDQEVIEFICNENQQFLKRIPIRCRSRLLRARSTVDAGNEGQIEAEASTATRPPRRD